MSSDFVFRGTTQWLFPNSDQPVVLITILTRSLLFGYLREDDAAPKHHIKLHELISASGSEVLHNGIDIQTQREKIRIICKTGEDARVLLVGLRASIEQHMKIARSPEVVSIEESPTERGGDLAGDTDPNCPVHGENSPLRYRSTRPLTSPRTMDAFSRGGGGGPEHIVKEWERPTATTTLEKKTYSVGGGGGGGRSWFSGGGGNADVSDARR
eukprot:PhF_6_TR41037/c0_g1_i1/m.62157